MRDNQPQLDWTISDAPAELEPWSEPALDPPRRARPTVAWRWALPRQAWLMLAALTLSALLVTVWGLPWLERDRARRAVAALIAREEAALAAGDWDTLATLYDPELVRWATAEIENYKLGGAPEVLRAYNGYPLQAGAELRGVRVLSPLLARAEMVRAYRLYSGPYAGLTATLVLPQFYRFAENGWVRTQAPSDWWGEAQHFRGARVDLDYRAVDATYAVELGRYVDQMVVEACRPWACPADLRVQLVMANSPTTGSTQYWGYSAINSLTFSFVTMRGGGAARVPPQPLSPQWAGVPQDDTTVKVIRQTLAAEVLLWVAEQTAGARTYTNFQPMLYALMVRELARLGLEAPGLAELEIANPVYSPKQLWALPDMQYPAEQSLPQALAVLNSLLDGQPAAVDTVLFQTLNTAPDLTTWLADGLGLSPAEVEARVAAALNPPVPLALAPSTPADLLLDCPTGPQLASLDGQLWPLLDGDYPNSYGAGWSPDGRRLAVVIAGRHAVIDLAEASGAWLPLPVAGFSRSLQWLSDTVVAYQPGFGGFIVTANQPDRSDRSGTHFYDAASPAQSPAPLSNYTDYVLSPDRTRAVVTHPGSGMALFIIPAQGGEPIAIGVGGGGSSPAQWSPDSRHVAYVSNRFDSSVNAWTVYVVDAATGERRELLSALDSRLPRLRGAQSVWVSVSWSPEGDELAVWAQVLTGAGYDGWVGLLAPDGSDWRLLDPPEPDLQLGSAAYSADGRYLAASLRQTPWDYQTALYDRQTRQWVRRLPGHYPSAWSSAGHTLALNSVEGPSLLVEPGDPSAQPLRLPVEDCYAASWRPGAPGR